MRWVFGPRGAVALLLLVLGLSGIPATSSGQAVTANPGQSLDESYDVQTYRVGGVSTRETRARRWHVPEPTSSR